ncbi:hypothetical protein HK102_006708, partial [Quaeritorhiza haematococci]
TSASSASDQVELQREGEGKVAGSGTGKEIAYMPFGVEEYEGLVRAGVRARL